MDRALVGYSLLVAELDTTEGTACTRLLCDEVMLSGSKEYAI